LSSALAALWSGPSGEEEGRLATATAVTLLRAKNSGWQW